MNKKHFYKVTYMDLYLVSCLWFYSLFPSQFDFLMQKPSSIFTVESFFSEIWLSHKYVRLKVKETLSLSFILHNCMFIILLSFLKSSLKD